MTTKQLSIVNDNPSRNNLTLPYPNIINNPSRTNSFTYSKDNSRSNMQSLSPAIISPRINTTTLSPSIINQNVNNDSLSPLMINTDINSNASLSPAMLSPNISNVTLSPVMLSPNINNASLSPVMLGADLNNGVLSPGPISPRIINNSLSPGPISPNINSATMSPLIMSPNINNALPPAAISPHISTATLSPVIINTNNTMSPGMLSPNINHTILPGMMSPGVHDSTTLPGMISPNINASSVLPGMISPNINNVALSPVIVSPNINNTVSTNISINNNIENLKQAIRMKSPNIQYTTVDNPSDVISNDINNTLTLNNDVNITSKSTTDTMNSTQGFKPNMVTNIFKAIQNDPTEFNEIENINNTNLQYNNIVENKSQMSTLFTLKNNDSLNDSQSKVFVPSIDAVKSDIMNDNNDKNKSSKEKEKEKSKKKLNNNKRKDDSNKDEIQEFVEDFLMDAFLSSKEIDLEHHKDLFTAPAFDSENNLDQNNISYLMKQQNGTVKGNKNENDNIQDSSKFDPMLELNKMKNTDHPIKSYSTPDLLSIKNAYSPNTDVINNSSSNQYLNPLNQISNNRVLSPLDSEKNPVLSPMGYNAAMFLASNSIKSSKQLSNNNSNNLNNDNNISNNNKLSVSNNFQNNNINSPIHTISPRQASQDSFDSLNIPKNSEILYSPDLNINNIGNSLSPVSDIKPKRRHSFSMYNSYPTDDKQPLQIVNNNLLDLSTKNGISYPHILKPDSTDSADRTDSVVSSPQFINSPLVSSPTSTLNEFNISYKGVSSPQHNSLNSHISSHHRNTENDVQVVNSIILNDYNSYLLSKPSQESSNTKKTPSIVLTPSTDSLVLPTKARSIDQSRNIIHPNNSLTLTVPMTNTNNVNNINNINNNGYNYRGINNDSIEFENMNDKRFKKRKGRKPKQLESMNNENSSLQSYSEDISDDTSFDNSKESKTRKNKKRKSQENNINISKKKSYGRKTKSEDEELRDESSNQSMNSNNSSSINDQEKSKMSNTSNGRVIKYPRIYECKFPGCNKAFTKAHNLRSHERSHMNDRPYSCKYCEKSFVRQYDLLRHERIHTGVKPYVCKKCLAAFSRNDAYNKHIRSCFGKN